MSRVRDHRQASPGAGPADESKRAVVVPSRRGRSAVTTSAAAGATVVVPTRRGGSTGGVTSAPWRQYRGDGQGTGHAWWNTELPHGRVVWTHAVNPMVDSSPVVGADGAVYVGSGNSLDISDPSASRVLVAVNPDGTERWATGLQADGIRYVVRGAPAIRNDGRLVVVGGTGHMTVSGDNEEVQEIVGKGRVFLVSASGGVEHYSEEYEGPGTSSPLLDAQDNTYFWSLPTDRAMPYVVWKINSQFTDVTSVGGLEPKWVSTTPWWWILTVPLIPFIILSHFPVEFDASGAYRIPPPLLPSPVLGGCGDVVAAVNHTLRCWTDGHNLWEKDIGAVTTPAIGGGGRAYIPTNGRLEARDQGGDRRWNADLGSSATAPPALGAAEGTMESDYVPPPATYHGPVVRDHRFGRDASSPRDIYVPLANGNLCSLDYKGNVRWSTKLSDNGLGAPVCVQHAQTHEQRIVVGSADGSLFALNRDGEIVWQTSVDSPILGTPAPANGRIYVATQTALIAIE